jgi:ribulose-phosphate 3-epimerase
MAVVCPAILAASEELYGQEIEKIGGLVDRIQIDLTDGKFAQAPTVKPEQAWWPVGVKADFHLMYEDPLPAVKTILSHPANLIIVHAEAKGSFDEVVNFCRQADVKVGVALLPATAPEKIEPALPQIDHVLIFSGSLGSYGGHSDLTLLHKVQTLKQLKPGLEVGWDGGVNDRNVQALVKGGVDVLNVGGFIQNSPDPANTIRTMQQLAKEVEQNASQINT